MPYGNRPNSIFLIMAHNQKLKNANDLNQGDEYFLEILCVIMETLLTLFNFFYVS